MTSNRVRLATCAVLASALLSGTALAQDFHGFDPANFDGAMLSAEQLAAMVEDATANHPPRNGEQLTVGA